MGGNTSCGPSQGLRDAKCWKEREGSWPGRRFRRANREGEESRGKALAEEGQEDLGKIQVVELAARSDLCSPLLPGDALLLLISGDSHIAYGFHTGPPARCPFHVAVNLSYQYMLFPAEPLFLQTKTAEYRRDPLFRRAA